MAVGRYFIALVSVFHFVFSQEMSLKECAELALNNNIDLRQAAMNIESAKINQQLAKNSALPSVNGNVNYGYNFGRSIDPVSNQFITQRIANSFMTIDANVVLYNFGRINQSKNQQNASLQAANFEKEDIKNTLLLNVVQAYAQVLFQKELLKIAINQVATTKTDIERTQKLVTAGIQTELNLINLKAKLANDELALTNSENQLRIAKLNLVQWMNVPNSELDLDKFDIQTPEIKLEESVENISSSEIYKKAFENQPSIKNMTLRMEAAEFSRKSNTGAKYPTLSLNGSVNTRYSSAKVFENFAFVNVPFFQQIDNNLGQSLYLSLNVPVFNNYRLRANEQSSMINKERTKLNLENASYQLRKKVETAQTDYMVSQKRFSSLENLKNANDEALKATQKRFDAGLAHSVELVTAQNNLFKSNADLVQSKFDLYLKRKVLDFYISNEITY